MSTDNTKVTFKGNKLTLQQKALTVGSPMPTFTLTANDMSDLKSESLKGKILVICGVPSLDTPTCNIQTKRFNSAAENLSADVVILTVSMDLPFAQSRWCGAEGVKRVITGSDYKYHQFGKAFGAFIEEWALLARAVFVVDKTGTISYVEYVSDISAEPNYEAALAKVSELLEK